MARSDVNTDNTGFTLFNCTAPQIPVLLSVPHAGRDYPAELLDKLRVPAAELVRLEDRYADRLVQPAIARGVSVIVAHKPRAWIDLNRHEQDVDPAMLREWPNRSPCKPSAKSRGGLGLIPRRLTGCGDLWKSPLELKDIEGRLRNHYFPYHAAIEHCLETMRRQFGAAILLDIHSMPPLAHGDGWSKARIVVGDRFGQSSTARFSEAVLAVLSARNIEVMLNHPYPGDHILRRHGNPKGGIHAIQIEIDRSLYLDDLLREPTTGIEQVSALVAEMAFAVSDQAGWQFAEAAE